MRIAGSASRTVFACALLLMAYAASAPGAGAQMRAVRIEDQGEIREHLIGEQPEIRTAWREAPSLSEQANPLFWGVRLTVDRNGAVVAARTEWGAKTYRREAENAARQLRFRPFERDGGPVRAHVLVNVLGWPQDYSGPSDRSFPTAEQLSDVRIRLQRTGGCLIRCPVYRLEITGDGDVLYRGESHVLVQGEHRWTIPQEDVTALIALFRRADYFRLEGHYILNGTDIPTYLTGLQIGLQRKFVYNDGGDLPSRDRRRMPSIVSEIEDTIDRISGAEAWVSGNEQSAATLSARGWNFRSREGAAALRFLLENCKLPAARAFLAQGAPVVETRPLPENETPAIESAPRCGDHDLVRMLIARGALVDQKAADAFLARSAESGFPRIVALALQHSRNMTPTGFGDGNLLTRAVRGWPAPDETSPFYSQFSVAGVVELLLANGADPRASDALGETPLHGAPDAATVGALVAAGADPMARDRLGRTPLETVYDESAAQALIAAGAEIPSDPQLLNALIGTARQYGWSKLLPILTGRANGAPAR